MQLGPFARLPDLDFYRFYPLSRKLDDTLRVYLRRFSLLHYSRFGQGTNRIRSKPTPDTDGQPHSHKKFARADRNPLTNYLRSVKNVARKN